VAWIGAVGDAAGILRGEAGTRVAAGVAPLELQEA
jgi:hypothetical protein